MCNLALQTGIIPTQCTPIMTNGIKRFKAECRPWWNIPFTSMGMHKDGFEDLIMLKLKYHLVLIKDSFLLGLLPDSGMSTCSGNNLWPNSEIWHWQEVRNWPVIILYREEIQRERKTKHHKNLTRLIPKTLWVNFFCIYGTFSIFCL